MNKVIIPLNALIPSMSSSKQVELLPDILAAEAYGVEVRRELMSDPILEVQEIRNQLIHSRLFCIYSAPVELWGANHDLQKEILGLVAYEAKELGAKWIKLSLGHYEATVSDLSLLKEWLASQIPDIQLLIENDQTEHGGDLQRLETFFVNADKQDVPIKMAFDSGNWLFTKEEAELALPRLSPYIIYLHLKHVIEVEGELKTYPILEDKEESWKKIVTSFPSNTVKALEFPLYSTEEMKKYINLLHETELERAENR